MNDFFNRQNLAQSRVGPFYIAFGLVLAGAVGMFYFTVTGCFLLSGVFYSSWINQPGSWWEALVQYSLPPLIYGDPKAILALRPMLIVAPILVIFILFMSYYKISLIKNGGAAYLFETMGGVLIGKPKSVDERRLISAVEEMALAVGLPKPRVYSLPKEWSVNAVTAGLDYEGAVIAVTAGVLKHLDRDELRGVIAHEYEHILNGDYALNLTMAGWLYGLLFFSVQGRDMMASAKDFMGDVPVREVSMGKCLLGLPMYLLGLVMWFGGLIGVLAADILQAGMSRRREQAADAFAIQITSDPRGLAGALKKIAAFPQRGIIKSGQALIMKSFFIASPGRSGDFLRSRPTLESRILALDPGWSGDLTELMAETLWPEINSGHEGASPAFENVTVKKSSGILFQKMKSIEDNWIGPLVLGMLAGYVGQYETADEIVHRSLEISRQLYEKMPLELLAAANDTGLVSSLIAAVFLHDESEIRLCQDKIITQFLGAENLERCINYKALIEPRSRLPLLSLSSPVLMSLSPAVKETLLKTAAALIAADKRLDLFGIVALQILQKRLKTNLSPSLGGNSEILSETGNYVVDIQSAVVAAISVLSHLSDRQAGKEKINKAFRAGMAHFDIWPDFAIVPPVELTSKDLILALKLFGQAPVNIKNNLILAAINATLHDNDIFREEYELLRALAAAIDMPLPYFSI